MTQAPQIGLKCMSHNGLKVITKIPINTQLLFIVDMGSNDPPFIIPCLTTGTVNIFLKYMCPPLDYIKAHPLSSERYDRFLM